MRERTGLSRAAFCRRIGYDPRRYGNMFSRGDSPSVELVLRVVESTDVDAHWLLTGRAGPGPAPGVQDQEATYYVRRYEVALGAGDGRDVQDERPAGLAPYPLEEIKRLTTNPENLAQLVVEGESMVPTFQPGDRVLVDMTKGRMLKDGIWAINLDDALLIKRLQRLPGHVLRFTSDNPAYQPFEVKERELGESVQVIGQVLLGAKRY